MAESSSNLAERSTRDLSHDEQSAESDMLSAAFGSYAPGKVQRLLIALARGTFLHRGKLRYLMSRLIYRLNCPVDITRYGGNFRVGLHDNLIEYGLMLHPDYNRPEIEFLCEPLSKGSVALDIGSNIGLYSVPLAKTGARVISIDANPAMVAQLRFNMRASGMDDADVLHVAVSDEDGTASLQIHNDDVAIVNIVEDADGDVEIRRLETILNERGVTRVDVLKIDIEGHEDKALAPYLNAVADIMIPERIVIERVGPEDYPACAEVFDKLGYQAVGRTRSNSLYKRIGPVSS